MTMIDESTLAETIAKLSQQMALTATRELSQAAAATGGLPVHADAGGVLVIDRAGSVLHYDPDAGSALQVTDGGWQTLALSKAASMFPELEVLRPLRPEVAVDCRTMRRKRRCLRHDGLRPVLHDRLDH